MKSATQFLEQVRALVEPLKGNNDICEMIVAALNEHNEHMLHIATSDHDQDVRTSLVEHSRSKLIERLEDIAELWLNAPK